MPKQRAGFYLRVAAPGSEPRKYFTLEGAIAAMSELVQLQRERGFVTIVDTDARHSSRHPDGRTVQFWAENERGEVIG